MIAIEANITLNDILTYTFYRYYRNIGRLVIQALVFLAVMVWLYEELSQHSIDMRISMFAFIGVVYLYLLMPIRLYFSSKKVYKANAEFHYPIKIIFEEESIQANTHFRVHTHKWELIHKIIETRSLFLFYFSELTVTLIPKTAFTTRAQAQELKRLIASKKEIKKSLLKD